ncbi:D-alanyl-D-alanine carboxypeptidase DacB precursor [Falsiruegeria litorea R37]|uniref:D-alanyl-D-alanine carboxypeptidase DacB n=1 Tax=Falsiruegeria litorea R37 TaxID=1200284 RepID=A0A1Y5TM13_9RHOB|nr:D-alanyl-D-alanine carboxypeptidase/D-alanyl-D-alanine-endopeptidase [Falsiruegeria litorea]SLN67223.1 D-alanyl-D-alanine carboxypeptidase DacB precursor [Falsiruegeria litorea R37]
MSGLITRRFLLGALGAISVPGTGFANAPVTSLRPQMRGLGGAPQGGPETVIKASGLSGDVAFAVADAKTGLQLEAVGSASGLPPASVAKALTALYALDVLGAGHVFRTELVATGPVKNGVLRGDLVLVGGGDPTLDTNSLAKMAGNLKAAGVREVRGAFKVYDGALPYVRSIDPAQPDHLGYSPSVAGIALNFNRVHFEWKRGGKGYTVAMDARSNKYKPQVAMAQMQVKNRRLPVYTYEETQRVDKWTVASQALGKGGSRWLPVRKPALYAGDVFQTLARANGIVLKNPKIAKARPGGTVLTVHQSAPLQSILKGMLKYSTNLTAEMVGMFATAARSGTPNSLKSSAQEMSRWAAAKYGMKGTSLVDHSGLGDASRMTPQDLLGALVQVHKQGILRPLLKPFAMRDSKGRVLKSHPIKVDAKTGTLNFVSGLGGFMTAADGTELAFAIFTADTAKRSRIKRADREVPEGARAWNRRSKRLQQKLIERWGALYGS